MKKIFFFLCSIVTANIFAQNSPPLIASSNDSGKIYDLIAIEQPAQYPGGNEAMFNFLKKNTFYPKSAQKNGIQGKAFITFVIDKNGDLIDIELYKGVTVPKEILEKHADDEEKIKAYKVMAKELDEEAIRVVRLFPQWKPGVLDGKTVKMRYILPFNFKLS